MKKKEKFVSICDKNSKVMFYFITAQRFHLKSQDCPSISGSVISFRALLIRAEVSLGKTLNPKCILQGACSISIDDNDLILLIGRRPLAC